MRASGNVRACEGNLFIDLTIPSAFEAPPLLKKKISKSKIAKSPQGPYQGRIEGGEGEGGTGGAAWRGGGGGSLERGGRSRRWGSGLVWSGLIKIILRSHQRSCAPYHTPARASSTLVSIKAAAMCMGLQGLDSHPK